MPEEPLPAIPGYEADAELGRGGMGVVYRVRQQTSGCTLALKMILCGRGATLEELIRFRIEAEALACLHHTNIIEIRDVGVWQGYPYFALDFAEKGSLKQIIHGQPQPPRYSAELVRTLALAMQHSHERGMLHRDLKPANILIMSDGTPKITDFGLVKFANPIAQVSEMHATFTASALDMVLHPYRQELTRHACELQSQYPSMSNLNEKNEDEAIQKAWQDCSTRTHLLDDQNRLSVIQEYVGKARQQALVRPKSPLVSLSDLTRSGTVMGSPQYMAPEQASGDLGHIGPATDVYALGGILYELLSGRPPFQSLPLFDLLRNVIEQPPISPRHIEPRTARDIEAICLKCLEKTVNQRYPTALALAEDLARYLDGYAVLAGDFPTTPRGSVASPEVVEIPSTASQMPISSSPNKKATRSWWPFAKKQHGA